MLFSAEGVTPFDATTGDVLAVFALMLGFTVIAALFGWLLIYLFVRLWPRFVASIFTPNREGRKHGRPLC